MLFELNNYIFSGFLIGFALMIFFIIHFQIPFTEDKRPNTFLILIIVVFLIKKIIQFFYPLEEEYGPVAGGLLYTYTVLISVLGYYYVKYEIKQNNLILRDILRLVSLLVIVFVSAFLLYYFKVNDVYFLFYDCFLIISLLLLYFGEFSELIKLIKLINSNPNNVVRKKIFWYRFLFYGIFSYQIIAEVIEVLYVNKLIENFTNRSLVLNIVSIVYLTIFTAYALYNGFLFKKLIFLNKENQILNVDEIENDKQIKSIDSELLDESKSQSIYSAFQELVVDDKLFLQEELKIEDVSKLIAVNTKYLSFAINRITGSSFPEYINKLRIEEVNKRLVDPEYKHLTIIAIANDCGFRSKSCFNRVYKKHTGISPSEYQTSFLNQ